MGKIYSYIYTHFNSTEVYFNFDLPFEIHDDNEILYRLGLDEDVSAQSQEFYQQQMLLQQQQAEASSQNADDRNTVVVTSGAVMPEHRESEEQQ
jgi:hypothetical protein